MFRRLDQILDQICLPAESAILNQVERSLIYHKNRSIILFLLTVIFFSSLICLFFDQMVKTIHIHLIIILIMQLLTESLFSRTNHSIFQVYRTLFLGLTGPGLLYFNPGSILGIWMTCSTVPIMTMYITGEQKYLVFQSLFQIFICYTLYLPSLLEKFIRASPEYLTERLTELMIYCITLNLIVFFFLSKGKRIVTQIIEEVQRDKIETQKLFLLSFSHEFRNLLNTLLGSLEVGMAEVDSTNQKDYINHATMSGQNLLHLVNNILDSGKASVGEIEINPLVENIYDKLQRTWRNCSHTITHKHLQGKLVISKKIPLFLKMDYLRVNQIILNLVSNAVKFTENGSVRIKVDWIPEKRSVDDECFQPQPYHLEEEGVYEKDFDVLDGLDNEHIILGLNSKKIKAPENRNIKGFGILRIHVQDTGQGIDEKLIKQIFDSFTTNYNRKNGHLAPGLGLYVSKQLASCMQGDLRVFSKKNTGSTFILCIPMEAFENDEHVHSSNESIIEGTIVDNKSALIVDDEPFNVHIMSGYVNMCGLTVADTAANGQIGYQKYIDLCVNKKQPNLVFMDLLMPIIDGKECCRLIRQYEKEKKLPPTYIIITSGNCNKEDIEECLNPNLGIKANVFLKKPIKKEDVHNEIRKCKLIK